MPTYGFRIHTMKPRVGRTQKFLQIDDVSPAGGVSDAVDELFQQVLALKGALKIGAPTYFSSEQEDEFRKQEMEKKNDLPYFIVEKVERFGRRIEILIETGREADHDALRSRDGTTEPMKQRAATRRSNVIILVPSKGEYAFLISEVRGQTYAGELLILWLTRTAQRSVVTVDSGVTKQGDFLGWKLDARIDGERLDGILSGSSEHSFKLRRRTITSAGSRNSYDLELVQYGLKKASLEKVLDMLQRWSERRNAKTATERRAAAAADVATLVEPIVGGVEFTDGEFSFKEHGKTQTINSETIDQLFVYPLGNARPTVATLYAEAQPILKKIAPTLNIQL